MNRTEIEFILGSENLTQSNKVDILVSKIRQYVSLASGLVRRLPEEEKQMRTVDMYGNEIQPGDYINYPVRKGSDTYMRTAKVISVDTRKNHLGRDENILRVAVAIAPRWADWKGKGTPDTRIARAVVSRPHRATIIPKPYVQRDPRYTVLASV